MGEPAKSDLRRLEDMRAGNKQREAELTAKGVSLPDEAVLALQVRALKRMLVDGDPEAETAYGLAYQEVLGETFDRIEADLNRAKLTAPRTNGKLLELPRRPGG